MLSNGKRFYDALLFSTVLSLSALFILLEEFWGGWRHENEPLHAVVETTGSVAALVLAVLLLNKKGEEDGEKLSLLGLGLLGMGILDVFHAARSPGQGFVLLHNAAGGVGAVFFALSWVAAPFRENRWWKRNAPSLVISASVLFGLWVVFARGTFPLMREGGEFTVAAMAMNLASGLLFLAAAVRLLLDFHRNDRIDTYLFASMAALFGMAGLMFPFSALWDNSWWLWHFVRLAAFAIALGHSFAVFRANELRIIDRTARLEAANKELEAFSYSVSHDLRAPLRSIDGFSQALFEDYQDLLDDQGKDYLQRLRTASQRMGQLIDDVLKLLRVTRSEMRRQEINLSAMAEAVAGELRETNGGHEVDLVVATGMKAVGDAYLLRIVLENLLGNAWKFTAHNPKARVEFGSLWNEGGKVFFVRDNGVGFDMAYADKLFGAFQRLHGVREFPGTGIGLATVQRVINKHGGRVWAEGEVEKGATFYFSLP